MTRSSEHSIPFIKVHISAEEAKSIITDFARRDVTNSYALEENGVVFVIVDKYGDYIVSLQKKGT